MYFASKCKQSQVSLNRTHWVYSKFLLVCEDTKGGSRQGLCSHSPMNLQKIEMHRTHLLITYNASVNTKNLYHYLERNIACLKNLPCLVGVKFQSLISMGAHCGSNTQTL